VAEYTPTVTSSNKRQRQLARQKYERQQQRRSQSAARRRIRQRIAAAVVVVVLVAGTIAWIVIGRASDTAQVADASSSASPAASAAPSVAASGAASSGAPSAASSAASAPASAAPSVSAAPLSCTEPGTPRADTLSWPSAPPAASGPATITLQTNCGPIVITTLPDKAPLTVGSEVFLANEGFYDQTSCHRLTTAGIYVLQCGDPKGNGTGGPGYSVPDENLPAEGTSNYPAGTVAMANAGPGTAGSQFFVVYQDTTLPSGYTIWGTVTQGLDILQGIAAAGVSGGSADGPPAQPVFITKAIVTS